MQTISDAFAFFHRCSCGSARKYGTLAAVTGTILNGAGILMGGILGLTIRKQLSVQRQLKIKLLLTVLVIIVGLQMTWSSLGGGFWPVLKVVGRGAGKGSALSRLEKLNKFIYKHSQDALTRGEFLPVRKTVGRPRKSGG